MLQIQRMSTEDGPGLRSTAFLKACPLSCAWCHNPEGISAKPEVEWTAGNCIAAGTKDGCGACVAACPSRALARDPSGALRVDRRACAAAQDKGDCRLCAAACPAGAVQVLGTRYSASRLADELAKDSSWFSGSDRGGVTLSGGEASAQPAFARETLRLLKGRGIHTALDTCGVASWENLCSLYPYVDLLLWDLKESDSALHARFTGLGNERILENLKRTADWMGSHSYPRAMWIRTPVVPRATDREDNLLAIGKAIARIAVPRLERWELCAFNNLCAEKYRRLDKEWEYATSPLMKAQDMDRLLEAGKRGLDTGAWTGAQAPSVAWTGSTGPGTGRKEA